MKIMYAILLSFCLIWVTFQEDPSLAFVAQFIYSGARFPAQVSGKWFKKFGGLTNVGIRQLYLLGREMRKQYIEDGGLLDSKYNPYQFLLRASNDSYRATIMSAYAYSRGLYLPGTGYLLNKYQMENAVPPTNFTNITNIKKDLGNAALLNYLAVAPAMVYSGGPDYILEAPKFCSGIQAMIDDSKVNVASRRNKLEAKFREGVYKELSEVFKTDVNSMKDALAYLDYILAAKYFAQPLPSNISDTGMHQLYEMNEFVNYQEYYGDIQVAQVVSYGVLNEVYELINKNMQGKDKSKKKLMVAYLMNDINMMGLLKLLNFKFATHKLQIPYASSLQIEIYKPEPDTRLPKDYVVKIIFNGARVPWVDGEKEVKLDMFLEWISDQTEIPFISMCDGTYDRDDGTDGPWLVAGAIVGIMLMVMLVATCVYMFKDDRDDELKDQAEEAKDDTGLVYH